MSLTIGADGTTITLATNGILSAAQFRTLIPAFNDSSIYSDDMLNLDLTLAASMLDANRWHDWRPLGMALMVAHFMSLDERENRVAKRGGVPGQGGVGILSSKSIGSVSASFDVSSGSELNAGHWNMTTYGRRYIHMARMVGTGGVQVTGSYFGGVNNADRTGPIF